MRQRPHLLELSVLSPVLSTEEVSCKGRIWGGREGIRREAEGIRGGSAGLGEGERVEENMEEKPELRMK